MAIENIPINSGTGPKVAVDLVGTDNYQVVKVVQAGDGSAGTLSNVFSVTNTGTATVSVVSMPTITATVSVLPAISGSVSILNTPTITATVSVMPAVSGSISVINTPTITGNITNIATITTLLGTIAVSGGGGGVQYSVGDTSMAATGTGTIFIGMQSGATTGRAIALSTTGGLIIASMPAVGGGQQYINAETSIGATGTGTLMIGVQSGATTSRAIVITTTGGLVIGSMPAVGGGQQYPVDSTAMGATATGTVILGMQSGATTGRALALTTTGAAQVQIVGTPAVTAANVTIASITTGTMNVINVLSATNVTIASIATGTVSVINTPTVTATVTVMPIVTVTASANPLIVSTVSTVLTMPVITVTASANPLIVSTVSTVLAMPVLSATNVTIASVATIATGTVSVINVLSATGVLLAATTAKIGAVVATAHASRFQAFVLATTSAAGGVIVQTSGAHTLYITDVLVSVSNAMDVQLCSETTAFGRVFLPTTGGFVGNFSSPLALTTAHSLRVVLSVSGTCGVTAVGYTVT